ncbi:MAG: nuclear transport factor 2 family protein [Burkholderiaceae bacterium]|nr:nuclear transport factor 2 family protein [Burkholderiaceae bacterium]
MIDDARLAMLRRFFETLSPESVAEIGVVYANDAYFKDPFNEVRGVAAIEGIFRHMFLQVDAPRFVIHDAVIQGDQGFVTWDFRFRMRRFSRDEQVIRGASHLRFGTSGLVVFHRDYWDAAEELYEKLPLLGGLMRFLRRRAAS